MSRRKERPKNVHIEPRDNVLSMSYLVVRSGPTRKKTHYTLLEPRVALRFQIPLIHLEMSERHHGRSKRSQYNQMTCDERSKESRCCRYPLIIDFDEFGWEWILQPRQYAAFYCAGECSFAFYPNSAHSQLVMLQKNRDLPGGPCCTPVKMQRMSMIYYDDAMVIKQRVLDDMIVESCGCN